MKCIDVQAILVEYVEGALGAADEMCMDIHLIQCEECRTEIAALHDLVAAVASEVHGSEQSANPVALLENLHAIEAERPRRFRSWRSRSSAMQASVAFALLALATSLVLFGRVAPAFVPGLRTPVAEARTMEVSEREWAPYLRREHGLLDLDNLGLVDPTPSAPKHSGD